MTVSTPHRDHAAGTETPSPPSRDGVPLGIAGVLVGVAGVLAAYGEFFPDAAAIAAVLAGLAIWATHSPSRRLRLAIAALLAVFVAINLVYAIGDLTHPESPAAFLPTALVIGCGLVTIVLAVLSARGDPHPLGECGQLQEAPSSSPRRSPSTPMPPASSSTTRTASATPSWSSDRSRLAVSRMSGPKHPATCPWRAPGAVSAAHLRLRLRTASQMLWHRAPLVPPATGVLRRHQPGSERMTPTLSPRFRFPGRPRRRVVVGQDGDRTTA